MDGVIICLFYNGHFLGFDFYLKYSVDHSMEEGPVKMRSNSTGYAMYRLA